jgi:hypothetical protein
MLLLYNFSISVLSLSSLDTGIPYAIMTVMYRKHGLHWGFDMLCLCAGHVNHGIFWQNLAPPKVSIFKNIDFFSDFFCNRQPTSGTY